MLGSETITFVIQIIKRPAIYFDIDGYVNTQNGHMLGEGIFK